MDFGIWSIGEFFIKEFKNSYGIAIGAAFAIFLIYLFTVSIGLTSRETSLGMLILIGILLSISMAGILNLTVFNRTYTLNGNHLQLELFWSYKAAFLEGNTSLREEIFCNILLFIPWGFLMSAAYPRFRKLWVVLVSGILLSGIVEFMQYALKLGLCEFDDVFNNTLGAVIGYGLYCMVKKRKKQEFDID